MTAIVIPGVQPSSAQGEWAWQSAPSANGTDVTAARAACDNDAPPQATKLFMYCYDTVGMDHSSMVESLRFGDSIFVFVKDDPDSWQQWNVIGTPTQNNNVWTIPVQGYAGSPAGTEPPDQTPCIFQFRDTASVPPGGTANQVLTKGSSAPGDVGWATPAAPPVPPAPATTVQTEATFGATAALGTSNAYAREDHKHGNPTHVDADHAAVHLNALAAPVVDVSMNTHKLTNVVNPVNAQDAATKSYVDTATAANTPQTRAINTTAPLTGGGNLTADRTLAITNFAGSAPGAVPNSVGGTKNFLRADAVWAAPTDWTIGWYFPPVIGTAAATATATTFVAQGGDFRSALPTGTPVKVIQTGTSYYGYVTATTYTAPNTTVTIAGNPLPTTGTYDGGWAYSYQNPPDMPASFAWTPTFTGFSAPPSGLGDAYFVDSRGWCCYTARHVTGGTSNAVTFTFTVPIRAVAVFPNGTWMGVCQCDDNGNPQNTSSHMRIAPNGTTIAVYRDMDNTANKWTASGSKRINTGTIWFPVR